MKVMLVEDEELIRKGLRKLVEEIIGGFTVVAEAENGRRALEAIKTNIPDLIITDIRMRDINGLELIERVRDQYSGIQFIILSGHNDFEYAKKAIRYGVSDYLLKPIDAVELTRSLERLKRPAGDRAGEQHAPVVAASGPSAYESQIIQKVKQIILSRLDEDLSQQYLAEQVNLNHQYLSTLFKAVTGQKYIDFVIESKIERARKLLVETNLKIYEIALLSGYPNVKHFNNIFRQILGVSPTEYRKQPQNLNKSHHSSNQRVH